MSAAASPVPKRALILDAAAAIFGERGFHRATVRDVARRAGVADGTIYNHFADKHDLLLGLLDRLNESDRRAPDLAAATTDPFPAFLAAYLRHRFRVLGAPAQATLRAVLSEVLVDPALRATYRDRILGPTFALAEASLARLVAEGAIRPFDAPLLARMLAAAVFGLLMLRLLDDEETAARWDDYPAALADLFTDGLLPDPEEPR